MEHIERVKAVLAAEETCDFVCFGSLVNVADFVAKYSKACESDSLKSSTEILEVYALNAEKEQVLFNIAVPSYEILKGTCSVTFEDLPLSQLLEYQFPEDDSNHWRVASLSLYALSEYQSKAFDAWLHQIKEPNCEAAFRRLLQAGVVTNVYDKHIFQTPPELKAEKYQVVSEVNGKVIDIPHPVKRLRIFDAAGTKEYRELDPTLAGAPKGEEAAEVFWQNLLEELKNEMGAEYVEGLLKKV
jgi:hypothetical protein